MKLSGASAIRELFSSTWKAIPDVHTEVRRVISQDEWAAWEWTMTATQTGDFPNLPATGRTFSIVGVSAGCGDSAALRAAAKRVGAVRANP